ncbi:YibE/F [Prauserella sp. PE36]|uniref:YibE/F family protein n=1 Tax=Prauserella sp. PE36 TaxID=1504709 RepID=UPI000DE53F0C|nr:YibE/F family protein [Prauserella sp. PE36]RBM16735.1 YibE/F [Prauserella sp. PE36]
MPRDISDDDTGPIRRVPAEPRENRPSGPRRHTARRATPERESTRRTARPRSAPQRPQEPREPEERREPAFPVGHGHGHGPAEPASRRVKMLLIALLAPLALATVTGVALLYPWGEPAALGANAVGTPVHGEVTAAEAGPCLAPGQVQVGEPPQGGSECLTVDVLLTDGDAEGTTIRKTIPLEPSTPRFAVGDAVVLAYSGAQPEDSESYQIQDFQRGTPLLILAGLFGLAVIALGRWRGLAALVALGLSIVALAVFVLPAILHGENPLLVAIAGSGLIMFVTLYLTHGLSARTSVAVLGTMVSLTLIGILSAIFSAMSELTGLSDDTSTLIASLGHGIDARGLLLAGVVIGALGVLDDVTVTQTSAVWELRRANPSLGWRELYGAGLRIGRDHVGSAVNTLVMAYAGAALPVLLLASLSGVGLGSILGSQDIASEIVRTLAGSIGIVAAVPVTTLLAALIVVREDLPDHISPANTP